MKIFFVGGVDEAGNATAIVDMFDPYHEDGWSAICVFLKSTRISGSWACVSNSHGRNLPLPCTRIAIYMRAGANTTSKRIVSHRNVPRVATFMI